MKTESTTFTTKKTLNEIANALRNYVASQKRAQIDKIEDDPLGGFGGGSPDISVVISGQKSAITWAERWGVQVYVTNEGDRRSVELIALGDRIGTQMALGLQSYRSGSANIVYMLHQSRSKMEEIKSVLC